MSRDADGYIPKAEGLALTKLFRQHLERIESGIIARLAARIAAGEDPVTARDTEVARGMVELDCAHAAFLDELHRPKQPS